MEGKKVDTNNEKNQYKTLASDIVIFVFGTVLAKAIQFILMPLYTTHMTTEAYGVAELTNNLSELFFPIATLCIYEAAFRYAVDPDFDNSILVKIISKVMGASCLVGAVIAIVSRVIFSYESAFYLYFILYAYSIRMCAAYFVRGKGQSETFVISGIINAGALGLFNFLFLVRWNLGEIGYLISIGMSYIVSAVYLVINGQIFNNSNNIKIVEKNNYRILLEYCIPLIFYNVLYWFTTISGRYVLRYFTDASSAGKYVAVIKISAVVNMIQQAVYAAFQLNSSRKYRDEDKESYYSAVTNSFIGLYCLFGSVVVCMTPILAKITLKNDFYSARTYLPIIMLAAILNCISSLLGTMYSTYKQTKRMVKISLEGALVNVLVCIFLTPTIGIWGVCVASVLCYLSQVIYKFIDVQRFCKIVYDWKLIICDIGLLFGQVIVLSIDDENYMLSYLIVIVLFIVNKKSVMIFVSIFKSLLSKRKSLE